MNKPDTIQRRCQGRCGRVFESHDLHEPFCPKCQPVVPEPEVEPRGKIRGGSGPYFDHRPVLRGWR